MSYQINPVTRIFNLVKLERKEISNIYFYAILSGLIQLSLPVGIQAIIGFVLGATVSTSLKILIVVVVAGVLIAGFLQVNQMKIIEKIQQKIFVRYSFQIAEKLPQLDMRAAGNNYLPELVNRFFDISSLQKSLSKLLLDIPAASMQMLLGLLLLSFYHPLFIVFSILLAALLGIILYYSGNKGLKTSLAESQSKYSVAAWLEEMARALKSIKFSKGTDFHLHKTDGRVVDYLKKRKSHFSVLVFQYEMLIFFKTFITATMLIIGSFLLINQQLNIGQFIAAEIIIITVINAVEKLINNLDSVYDVLTSVEKIGNITDKASEVSGNLKMKDVSMGYEVTLQNLSFGYERDKKIIANLNMTINPGEKICITGSEGSGKSTLLKLLTGSYKDFDGNILINKIPIRNYDLVSLRSHTGIFLSGLDIFEGTLEENITMGNESIDRAEVLDLFEKFGLTDFLNSLKNGFDTKIESTGHHLSSNVVRKILLIRAMVSKPMLLLLEDPAAGMDESFSQLVAEHILSPANPATVLITTNNSTLSKHCTKVVTL